jgi:hypothetical protein
MHIVLRVLDEQLTPEILIRNRLPVSRTPSASLLPLLEAVLIEGVNHVPRMTRNRDSAGLVQPPQPFDHRTELYTVARRLILAPEELSLDLVPDEDRGPATSASTSTAPTRPIGVEPHGLHRESEHSAGLAGRIGSAHLADLKQCDQRGT